jgi:hypothetical protein
MQVVMGGRFSQGGTGRRMWTRVRAGWVAPSSGTPGGHFSVGEDQGRPVPFGGAIVSAISGRELESDREPRWVDHWQDNDAGAPLSGIAGSTSERGHK